RWLDTFPEKLRERWKERAKNGLTTPTRTLFGHAQLGEIKTIIEKAEHWPAFAAYFPDKANFQQDMNCVLAIRNSADHAAQRKVYVSDEYAAFRAMIALTKTFHPSTAATIDRIFTAALDRNIGSQATDTIGDLAETNLGDFPTERIVGRAHELQRLNDFFAH